MLVETYFERWLAARKAAGVLTAKTDEQRMRDYVLPVLGKRPLGEVRRPEVKALVALLQATPSKHTGKPHSSRTIHRIYEPLRTMYAEALTEDLVTATPCTLKVKKGELPRKKDTDPRWRSGAIFTREEWEIMISDERIPLQRRVIYALAFFTGMRLGEVAGRQWRDYDDKAKPLGKLVCATQYDGLALKGDPDFAREVPVHPTLAKVLAQWRLVFPVLYGRAPKPDDFIVPKRAVGRPGGKPAVGMTPGAMKQRNTWRNLQIDYETLGFRRRRFHDTRRTLISIALNDGANEYLLRWITHGPPKSTAFDSYASPPWEALCKQIACLDVRLRGAAEVVQLTPRKAQA